MKYTTVTRETITELELIVGEKFILKDEETLKPYSHDESASQCHAAPQVVVKPQQTRQVSEILHLANREKIPVTFRGQGTGLSCGAVPIYGGIVMSFEAMNRIVEIDEHNLSVTVEAGVVLLNLREELENRGLFYPADPGERSSAIGGNVATNAGGMNGVKYGNTRGYVLGVEAVLASGKALNLGGKTIKRSSGYELMHLLVGSEGTLAAITKVTLRVIKAPKRFITLYIPFSSLNKAITVVPEIIRRKITPTAIEFFEQEPLLIAENQTGLTMPHHDAAAYLLIRIDGEKEEELYEMGQAIADICMENDAVDVLIAETDDAQQKIWDVRSRFYEALVQNQTVKIMDTVVPPSSIGIYMDAIQNIASKHGVRIQGYGHAGDGNIHLHLLKNGLDEDEWTAKWPKVMREVYRTAVEFGGTISGEHGIGLSKKEFFPIAVEKEELELMKAIKKLFDPNNILNPGKIFDME
ncbi:MAG: FAD-binding oxidoreductase [Candidatus Bathyarchaeota archaeon]|nr:MAG: FAD-binding oxidoreductase [Candidatus Bathyarchaeota archaeon]